MQRQHRLGRAGRISEIHRQGRSVANGLLVMRVLPNGLDRSRFCFVTGKRVGNAVVRNRVKRRLREVVRNSAAAPGWDTVLIARKGAGDADFKQLEHAVHNLIRRTRLNAPPASAEREDEMRDAAK
ncbi:MAG: ribonuclease P protein component [Chloroflexota bacterium]|nr:ribonuclease P protein component [Chloroflexota bacterium]MDE2961969.1 ribonuclease P protein component [Chloroflexota bacterium]